MGEITGLRYWMPQRQLVLAIPTSLIQRHQVGSSKDLIRGLETSGTLTIRSRAMDVDANSREDTVMHNVHCLGFAALLMGVIPFASAEKACAGGDGADASSALGVAYDHFDQDLSKTWCRRNEVDCFC